MAFAKKNGSIIIYDAAYSLFIRDTENCPRSIYEIEGKGEVLFWINARCSQTARRRINRQPLCFERGSISP